MKPLISIITVSYNSEQTIRDTIESVLNQTYDRIEYRIVDGASSDQTVQIAESYRERFAEKGISYQIVSEPDQGIYDAMNKGIRLAAGELVGLINSDDWYEKDALESVARFYEETGFDMMYGDVNIIRPSGSFVKRARLRSYITSRDWNHPTTFITRELYRRYQYRVHDLFDDFDLMLRIRKDGNHVMVLNKVLANFRFGGVSTEKSLSGTMEKIRLRYDVYRRNGLSRLYWFECAGMELAKLIIR